MVTNLGRYEAILNISSYENIFLFSPVESVPSNSVQIDSPVFVIRLEYLLDPTYALYETQVEVMVLSNLLNLHLP